MKKKIIFQKCHFNNIYFLFYIISTFINLLIENKLYPNKSEINDPEFKYFLPMRILNNLYISNISDFIAIIPYFISKRLLKKEESSDTNIKNEDNKYCDDPHHLIYNDYNRLISKKKKIILTFSFVIILDFLEKFALILYNIIYPDKRFDSYSFSCIIPFEIFFQFICSYFILKIHFYKLQYFSLFLNLGIFIIILIIDLINILKFNSFDGKTYYFYAFNIISYSIEHSLGKKILLYGFISIYLLIIIKGSIVLILVILFSLITFFVKKDIFSNIKFFLTNTKYILLIIAKIFSNFFVSLFTWLIIDRFSPNYLPLVLLFSEFCYFLVDIIYDSNNFKIFGWDLYIRIFLYLVSAIGVILHNEIVVINICNLGSDTKYFLNLKLENEELFTNSDNPEIIKRYETMIEMGSENGSSKDNRTEKSFLN